MAGEKHRIISWPLAMIIGLAVFGDGLEVFGDISILGEYQINLKNLKNPRPVRNHEQSEWPITPPTSTITVAVIRKITVPNDETPDFEVVTAPEGSTGKTILDMAGEKNDQFKATYEYYESLDDYFITSIGGVYNNEANRYSWFIYLNGTATTVGINHVFPESGDKLGFRYEQY